LALALPVFFWDLEKSESPLDHSDDAVEDYTPHDAAMAILADLAYLNGATGQIHSVLFDSSFKHKKIDNKCPSAELAARNVELSQDSYAQHKTYQSQDGKPCWYSVAEEQNEVVYVVIRGTQGFNDVLSDLNIRVQEIYLCGHRCQVHAGECTECPFCLPSAVPKTCTGINASALFVIEDSKPHISPFLSKGFSLVFTGHSLGAGTAALAAAHCRSQNEDGYKDATAVTFACPGIISGKECAKVIKQFVTAFIFGFDAVPRMSGVAIFNLLDKIYSNNWKEKSMARLAEEATKRLGVLGAMASSLLTPTKAPEKTKKKKQKQPLTRVQAEIEEGKASRLALLLRLAFTLHLQRARRSLNTPTSCPSDFSSTASRRTAPESRIRAKRKIFTTSFCRIKVFVHLLCNCFGAYICCSNADPLAFIKNHRYRLCHKLTPIFDRYYDTIQAFNCISSRAQYGQVSQALMITPKTRPT
jgi:hypothetical protein